MDISEIVSMNIRLLCHMHVIYGMKDQLQNEKKKARKIIKRNIIERMSRGEKWIYN